MDVRKTEGLFGAEFSRKIACVEPRAMKAYYPWADATRTEEWSHAGEMDVAANEADVEETSMSDELEGVPKHDWWQEQQTWLD